MTEELSGGMNTVRRIGDTVVRPIGAHSRAVHALLRHIRKRGFLAAPNVIAVGAATETLSFVPGETSNYPLTPTFRTDEALTCAARLLRDYHDATAGFDPGGRTWLLDPQEPAEVICHGDFAPYNCAVTEGRVTGMFDFDTAHPGPRMWDVGYGAYRWVPLVAPGNVAWLGDIDEQARRLRLFCETYGTDAREEVIDSAQERLTELVRVMREWAAEGHEAFAEHIADGHDVLYLADIEYLRVNSHKLAD